MSPAGMTQPMIQGLSDLIKQILYSQISNNNLGKDIVHTFYSMISPLHFGYLAMNTYMST